MLPETQVPLMVQFPQTTEAKSALSEQLAWTTLLNFNS
jgi:hypothetical protein